MLLTTFCPQSLPYVSPIISISHPNSYILTGVSDNGVSQDSDRQYMICSQVNNVYFPGIRDYAGDNHDWKASTSGPPYQISAFYTDEADESLELFKTQMLRYFPFMVLPGEYLS